MDCIFFGAFVFHNYILVSETVIYCCCLHFRIYIVHDEVKDKNFELELSWVGESK